MKLVKLYESLLVEKQVSSCVAKFGHELFGSELGGKEKNTGIENSYAREISDFTDNMYGQEITPEFMSAMGNLKGCVKQYPEVLVTEKTKIYRGLTISMNHFIDSKQIIDTKTPFPYVYKARSPIQSWSTSFGVASSFGNHDILNEEAAKLDLATYNSPEARQKLLAYIKKVDLRLAFVIEYQTNPKEFLFKSKYFKILSANEHEDEILRVDNTPAKVMAKFNEHEDVFLSLSGLKLIHIINKAIQES